METHPAIGERILAQVEDYAEIATSFATTTNGGMVRDTRTALTVRTFR